MLTTKPTPDFVQLAARIPAGGHIVIHSDFAEPAALLKQFASYARHFKGVNLHTLMPMASPAYAEPEAAREFIVNSFFPGGGLRRAVNEGLVQSRRCALTEIPGFFSSQQIVADMILLQVSPVDENGRVSLGLSVDYMPEVLAQKPIIVAQVNGEMPFTCGASQLAWDDIDYAVQIDEPLLEFPAAAADPVDAAIARHVAGLINDGDVLQTGIGALPDAVIANLGHLKHLGLHTGILTTGWQPLIESGVVDNSRKKAFAGKSITTMAGGSRDFYRFLHRNPAIEFHPCSFTHNFAVLSAIDNLCAINSVLQLDLSLRANAETVNGRRISSPGGLPDFSRGACAAPGGKSIIALRSSFNDGKVSNIVASLPEGAPTTIDGTMISHVVTEFGVADFSGLDSHGRDNFDLAKALIAIAHPNHQEALAKAWFAR